MIDPSSPLLRQARESTNPPESISGDVDQPAVSVDYVDRSEIQSGSNLGGQTLRVQEEVTSSTKKRKRGKQGAVSRAIATAKDRPGEPVFHPKKGTVFSSFEEAKDFYNYYSWEVGFGIREGRSHTNDNSYTTRKDIVCSCEGLCKNPDAATARCGCKARIRLHRTSDHAWIVTTFISDHNHPLSSTPGENRQWPSHSFIDAHTKDFITKLRSNNVTLGRVCSLIGVSNRDCKTQIRKQAVKNLCSKIAQDDIKDDMKKTLGILKTMKEADPEFDMRIETNENGTIQSMIWSTGKNKQDYKKFGDVVTFDTTYRTNLYNLPFGIFIGVNNHFQSIVFGGVLLSHERTRDFEWTFANFVDMMEGKHPQTILTDQCQAMGAAIKTTMKHSRHRWCRWHVLRLAKPKIGQPYSKKNPFKKEFNNLITYETSAAAFETRWHALVEKHNLGGNKFLQRAFRFRGMWAKPYFMNIFCAGMTSTQRSESANHMLKGFIQRSAPMHTFVSKFHEFQFDRNLEEDRQNHLTKQMCRKTRLGLPIEKHSEAIYTKEMHERFVNQLYQSGSFKIVEKTENLQRFTLVHMSQLSVPDSIQYIVHITEHNKLTCSCGLYEHSGLPCRHMLKVLVHLDIMEIPSGNIHHRWLRDAVTENSQVSSIEQHSSLPGGSDEMKRQLIFSKALELKQSKHQIDDNDFLEAMRVLQNIIAPAPNAPSARSKDNNQLQATKSDGDTTAGSEISCPPRPKKNGRPRHTSLKSWQKNSKLTKDTIREEEEILATNTANYKTRSLTDLLHVT